MYYYVDHTSRFERNTGIQRCVRAIASGLIEAGVSLTPVVWNRSRLDLQRASDQALDHLSRWHGPDADAWSEQGHEPWLLIVELVSGPSNPSAAQLRAAADRHGLKLAWVFHDAIPLRWASLYGAGARATASHHATYMAGLAAADLVLANSHTTAQHLIAFLKQQHLPHGHVQALPLAEQFRGVQRIRPAIGTGTVHAPQRLLCVGSLEPRKNHRNLLKAVAWLCAQASFPAELVLVGWPNDPRVVSLVERVLQRDVPVRWEPDADDARLAELYHWCDATVVASLEEGFGLPVAESLWFGKPCLTQDQGALGELVRDGGCWPLQVQDWRQLAQGLAQWLGNPSLQRQVLVQLRRRELRTWRDYAAELLSRLAGCHESSWRQRLTPSP